MKKLFYCFLGCSILLTQTNLGMDKTNSQQNNSTHNAVSLKDVREVEKRLQIFLNKKKTEISGTIWDNGSTAMTFNLPFAADELVKYFLTYDFDKSPVGDAELVRKVAYQNVFLRCIEEEVFLAMPDLMPNDVGSLYALLLKFCTLRYTPFLFIETIGKKNNDDLKKIAKKFLKDPFGKDVLKMSDAEERFINTVGCKVYADDDVLEKIGLVYTKVLGHLVQASQKLPGTENELFVSLLNLNSHEGMHFILNNYFSSGKYKGLYTLLQNAKYLFSGSTLWYRCDLLIETLLSDLSKSLKTEKLDTELALNFLDLLGKYHMSKSADQIFTQFKCPDDASKFCDKVVSLFSNTSWNLLEQTLPAEMTGRWLLNVLKVRYPENKEKRIDVVTLTKLVLHAIELGLPDVVRELLPYSVDGKNLAWNIFSYSLKPIIDIIPHINFRGVVDSRKIIYDIVADIYRTTPSDRLVIQDFGQAVSLGAEAVLRAMLLDNTSYRSKVLKATPDAFLRNYPCFVPITTHSYKLDFTDRSFFGSSPVISPNNIIPLEFVPDRFAKNVFKEGQATVVGQIIGSFQDYEGPPYVLIDFDGSLIKHTTTSKLDKSVIGTKVALNRSIVKHEKFDSILCLPLVYYPNPSIFKLLLESGFVLDDQLYSLMFNHCLGLPEGFNKTFEKVFSDTLESGKFEDSIRHYRQTMLVEAKRLCKQFYRELCQRKFNGSDTEQQNGFIRFFDMTKAGVRTLKTFLLYMVTHSKEDPIRKYLFANQFLLGSFLANEFSIFPLSRNQYLNSMRLATMTTDTNLSSSLFSKIPHPSNIKGFMNTKSAQLVFLTALSFRNSGAERRLIELGFQTTCLKPFWGTYDNADKLLTCLCLGIELNAMKKYGFLENIKNDDYYKTIPVKNLKKLPFFIRGENRNVISRDVFLNLLKERHIERLSPALMALILERKDYADITKFCKEFFSFLDGTFSVQRKTDFLNLFKAGFWGVFKLFATIDSTTCGSFEQLQVLEQYKYDIINASADSNNPNYFENVIQWTSRFVKLQFGKIYTDLFDKAQTCFQTLSESQSKMNNSVKKFNKLAAKTPFYLRENWKQDKMFKAIKTGLEASQKVSESILTPLMLANHADFLGRFLNSIEQANSKLVHCEGMNAGYPLQTLVASYSNFFDFVVNQFYTMFGSRNGVDLILSAKRNDNLDIFGIVASQVEGALGLGVLGSLKTLTKMAYDGILMDDSLLDRGKVLSYICGYVTSLSKFIIVLCNDYGKGMLHCTDINVQAIKGLPITLVPQENAKDIISRVLRENQDMSNRLVEGMPACARVLQTSKQLEILKNSETAETSNQQASKKLHTYFSDDNYLSVSLQDTLSQSNQQLSLTFKQSTLPVILSPVEQQKRRVVEYTDQGSQVSPSQIEQSIAQQERAVTDQKSQIDNSAQQERAVEYKDQLVQVDSLAIEPSIFEGPLKSILSEILPQGTSVSPEQLQKFALLLSKTTQDSLTGQIDGSNK